MALMNSHVRKDGALVFHFLTSVLPHALTLSRRSRMLPGSTRDQQAARRVAGRFALWILLVLGYVTSWQPMRAARAAPRPAMLTMATITVHGFSPLGSLVNRIGTRAV